MKFTIQKANRQNLKNVIKIKTIYLISRIILEIQQERSNKKKKLRKLTIAHINGFYTILLLFLISIGSFLRSYLVLSNTHFKLLIINSNK